MFPTRLTILRQRDAFGFLAAFDEQAETEELVIPADLTGVDDETLNALHDQATEAFDLLYADGDVDDETLEQLRVLTDQIDSLREELSARSAKADERRSAAEELAQRARPDAGTEDEPSEQVETEDTDATELGKKKRRKVEEEEIDDDAPEEEDTNASSAAESVAASGVRINLSGLSRRRGTAPQRRASAEPAPRTIRDVVSAAPDLSGFSNGQGLDWGEVAQGVDRRLQGYNHKAYAAASRAGRSVRQQFGVATIRRDIPDDLTVGSDSLTEMDAVLQRAMDEHRLPKGSLVASGGWCAPSETLYGLCELESTDGLFSLPEIGIARGGIRWTTGPDYSSIYSATGFAYTEEQDEAGTYGLDENGVGDGTAGDKPFFKVECPDDWEEARLQIAGLAINSGLLQQRGYPEMLARTIRGALTAHVHRVDSRVIASIVAGSTAVAMPAGQVGTIAPVLTAIELQVEHMRYKHRLSRTVSLEAVFPFWVRGAVRSDLSRRLGVNLLSVTDAQIAAWFVERGISAQFVYNWQGLEGNATQTAWPTEVSFLLYPAGTWVKGVSDIITLDTIYDSTLLAQNDFTALFTEEGWLTAKLCHDSRVVTVPIEASGNTGGGVDIAHDGSLTPAPVAG